MSYFNLMGAFKRVAWEFGPLAAAVIDSARKKQQQFGMFIVNMEDENVSIVMDVLYNVYATYIMYRINHEELYILSFEKGRGRRPWPFSQLRM